MSKKKADARIYLDILFESLCYHVNEGLCTVVDRLHFFEGALYMANFSGFVSDSEFSSLRDIAFDIVYGV